jgi:hypothetical protein
VRAGAGAPELVCPVCGLRQPDDVLPGPWAAAPAQVALDLVARFRLLPAYVAAHSVRDKSRLQNLQGELRRPGKLSESIVGN